MAETNWRDMRQGAAVDSSGGDATPVRLAVWRGPLGWARVALHLAGLGARDMGRNLRHELVWFFDRVSRLAVLAGLAWGAYVLARGDFRGPVFPATSDVSAWQALAWSPALVLAGAVGMGLVIALRPAPYRPRWD